MAFEIRNLCVLSYANGFTFWSYKSKTDTVSEIRYPDYFSEAADMLAPGDMIAISTRLGGTICVVDNTPFTSTVTVSPTL